MTTARELLQEARDAICQHGTLRAAIDAFLAQPERDPVAWIETGAVFGGEYEDADVFLNDEQIDRQINDHADGETIRVPLYAAQPEPAAKPKPSAEVERVMLLAHRMKYDAVQWDKAPDGPEKDKLFRAYDESGIALRAEVELLADEAHDWKFKAKRLETLARENRERAEAAEARLPEEMKHCTILFKECEKGHGWLTATNWIQHGCPTCEKEAAERDAERDAKRYRWLRNESNFANDHTPLVVAHNGALAPMLDGEQLDAAIDAAIAQEKK